MFRFTADGRAVLAVERDVEHARTELVDHVLLQLQALAHARLDAAVVVAHRQRNGAGLRAEQRFAGVHARVHDFFRATKKRRGKASSRLPSERAGYAASMRLSYSATKLVRCASSGSRSR